MRRLLLLGSLGVVAAAVTFVPLPLVELSPGPVLDVPKVVSFAGPRHHPVTGRLLATTVLLTRPRAPDVVAAWFRGDREILRERRVVPAGMTEHEYLVAERRVFSESARVGAAVGLRAAGLPVEAAGGGAQVASVVDGSPAEGRLKVGDVVTAADGRPVRGPADLVAVTSKAASGSALSLTVRRGSSTRDVRVQVRPLRKGGRPAVGVGVVTAAPQVELPFALDVRVSDVGGPSAGLLVALAAYEVAGPADVLRGRVVAGTGTVDFRGTVGAVGGVGEKVASAKRAHASVFLAPAGEAGDARAAAGGGITVVPVRTFDDALAALARS